MNKIKEMSLKIGKFADHHKSGVAAILTLSERAQATSELSAEGCLVLCRIVGKTHLRGVTPL